VETVLILLFRSIAQKVRKWQNVKNIDFVAMMLTTVSKNKHKLINLSFSEYMQKHDTVSNNPIQRTLLILARLWH